MSKRRAEWTLDDYLDCVEHEGKWLVNGELVEMDELSTLDAVYLFNNAEGFCEHELLWVIRNNGGLSDENI